jgi:hypothetical protein
MSILQKIKKTKMCHFYVDILNRNLKINIRI